MQYSEDIMVAIKTTSPQGILDPRIKAILIARAALRELLWEARLLRGEFR